MRQPGENTTLFRPALVLILVLISLFSLSAFMALSAFAPDLRSKSNGGAHAWSKSAVGLAAFAQYLEATGHHIIRSRRIADDGRPVHNLTILTPIAGQSAESIYSASVSRTLIVLPKWKTGPDPKNRQWVVGYGHINSKIIARMLNDLLSFETPDDQVGFAARIDRVALPEPEQTDQAEVKSTKKKRNGKWQFPEDKPEDTTGTTDAENPPSDRPPIHHWDVSQRMGNQAFELGKISGLQTISRGGLIPMIWSGDRILLAKIPKKEIYILSDPDLMTTLGFADINNPKAATRIIESLTEPGNTTLFDLTLHGFNQDINLLKTMLSPPYLAASLCALAAVVLMAWAAWHRFGPVQRSKAAHALGKTALAENSAALIKMAGREAGMVTGYGHLSRQLAARAIGAPKTLSSDQLDQFLLRVGKINRYKTTYAILQTQAKSGHLTRLQILDITQQFYQWRGEFFGENRSS